MTGKMTSRDRVYAALNHREADRVPIDFGGNYNTRVAVMGYNRLKKYLGISSPIYCRRITAQCADTDMDDGLEVMKLMGGDVIELPADLFVNWKDGIPDGIIGETREFLLSDGTTCIIPAYPPIVENDDGSRDLLFGGRPVFKMPKGGYYFDRIYHPLSGIETMEQMEEVIPEWSAHGFHGPLNEKFLKELEKYAKLAYEETEYFILANMPGNLSVWHSNLELFGYHKFLMMMASEPGMVHRWMDFTTSQNEMRLEQYLDACGKWINGIIFGDDYGTQRALQISPKMFREQVKPYFTRLCRLIHERAPHVKILLHACGSIKPIIGDLIEAGIDALNPIQLSARDMNPVKLKKEFGRDLTFWGGGISSQVTLFNGTEDDCRDEVKRNMDALMEGGGFVFATDHDIQEHVLPGKIMATFRTAQEHGKYR